MIVISQHTAAMAIVGPHRPSVKVPNWLVICDRRDRYATTVIR